MLQRSSWGGQQRRSSRAVRRVVTSANAAFLPRRCARCSLPALPACSSFVSAAREGVRSCRGCVLRLRFALWFSVCRISLSDTFSWDHIHDSGEWCRRGGYLAYFRDARESTRSRRPLFSTCDVLKRLCRVWRYELT